MSVDLDVPALFSFPVDKYDEHPSDFLGKGWIYGQRIEEAKRRVVRTIRNLHRTPQGVGFDFEVPRVDSNLEALASFIDGVDAERSQKVRKQRGNAKPLLGGDRYWIRSPQHVLHRRRALFSLDDLGPTLPLFYDKEALEHYSYEPFLDWMRWSLFHEALKEMLEAQEIGLLNEVWYLKVSTLDRYNKKFGRRSHKSRTKVHDSSYHGRPQRDRKRNRKRDPLRTAA